VGVIYRVWKRWERPHQLFIAGVLWMLSTSWLYDLYLFLRDGVYPVTWLANMAASSLLYAAAGLLWNLDWREGRGVLFAFQDREWLLAPDPRGQRHIFWFVVIFAALGAAMIIPYLRG
jgi:hypothetical protein